MVDMKKRYFMQILQLRFPEFNSGPVTDLILAGFWGLPQIIHCQRVKVASDLYLKPSTDDESYATNTFATQLFLGFEPDNPPDLES